MAGLLRDRYFEYAPDRAWDLVTGEAVSPIGETQDDDGESRPAFEPLIELLDHGREGWPRWFALDATPQQWRLRARLAAAAARRRGYVAIAVDVFLRMRTLLADELRTRAMVLIARPGSSTDLLHAALLHAAAISPGPHVLLTAPDDQSHGKARGEAHDGEMLRAHVRPSPDARRAPARS